MEHLLKPLFLFLFVVVALHFCGVKTRGKYSKSIWKSGDYIWLSMAFFAIISAAAEIRIVQAGNELPKLRSNYVGHYDQRISELEEFTEALKNLVIHDQGNPKWESELYRLADSAKSLDENMSSTSREISAAVENSKPWAWELVLKGLFPYLLALVLSIRLTMASKCGRYVSI